MNKCFSLVHFTGSWVAKPHVCEENVSPTDVRLTSTRPFGIVKDLAAHGFTMLLVARNLEFEKRG